MANTTATGHQEHIDRFSLLHDDIFSRLPQQAIDKCYRKLGVQRRERLGRSAPFEGSVLKDYGVWGFPLAGSTAAQHYAAAPALASHPMEPDLLPAMADARFGLFAVQGALTRDGHAAADLLTGVQERIVPTCPHSPEFTPGSFVASWYVRLNHVLLLGAGSLRLEARQLDILTAMLAGPFPQAPRGLSKLHRAAEYDPGRFAAFVVKSILDGRLYT